LHLCLTKSRTENLSSSFTSLHIYVGLTTIDLGQDGHISGFTILTSLKCQPHEQAVSIGEVMQIEGEKGRALTYLYSKYIKLNQDAFQKYIYYPDTYWLIQ
jgi:hypothetical protein